jgi:uncharacterized protein YdhG (YjbR/CyaY superfamily)
MTSDAKSVDEYLDQVPEQRLEALKELRALCLQYLPDHVESMAYKMPSYKRNDQVEVAFASQKQHICVYFLIHQVMLDNEARLEGINHGKGCLRFANPKKIDFAVIEDLLKATEVSEDRIC